MKDLNLLVWITQLGFSVITPLGLFTFLGVWLRNQQGWGDWIVVAAVLLGAVFAACGLHGALETMKRMSARKREDAPVSFNDHE